FILFVYLTSHLGAAAFSTYLMLERKYRIIPDHLSIPLIIFGVLISPVNPLFEEAPIWFPLSLWERVGLPADAAGGRAASQCMNSLMWGLSTAGLLLAFRAAANWILKKESLGLGDVKMLSGVATWLGGQGIFWTLLIGATLGSLV